MLIMYLSPIFSTHSEPPLLEYSSMSWSASLFTCPMEAMPIAWESSCALSALPETKRAASTVFICSLAWSLWTSAKSVTRNLYQYVAEEGVLQYRDLTHVRQEE